MCPEISNNLVVVTDCIDIAANELMGAVDAASGFHAGIRISPVVPVVPAFSIINGCFALRLIAETSPPGTVFLVTLSPTQEQASSVAGATEHRGFKFIGRNTGVFDWFVRDFGCQSLVSLDDHYNQRSEDYVAFPGKHVTAALAASLATGASPEDLGQVIAPDEIRRLYVRPGTVVHVDNFGLVKIFDLDLGEVQEGDRVKLRLGGVDIDAVFGHRMMSYDDGAWVLYMGSSLGMYEIGKVRENGAAEIGAKVGDQVQVVAI